MKKLKDLAFAMRDPNFARYMFKALGDDPGPLTQTGAHEVGNKSAYGFFESKTGDIYAMTYDEGILPVNAVEQALRLGHSFLMSWEQEQRRKGAKLYGASIVPAEGLAGIAATEYPRLIMPIYPVGWAKDADVVGVDTGTQYAVAYGPDVGAVSDIINELLQARYGAGHPRISAPGMSSQM